MGSYAAERREMEDIDGEGALKSGLVELLGQAHNAVAMPEDVTLQEEIRISN
jgi:hypothetical protein